MKAIIPAHLYDQPHHSPEQRANIKLVLDFYRDFVLDCQFEQQDRFLGAHYIQHNISAPDGIEGLKQFLTHIKSISADGTIKFHRALCDGNMVITHSEAKLSATHPTECVYDMFRIDANGKVAEHWDAIVAVPDITASGNSPF